MLIATQMRPAKPKRPSTARALKAISLAASLIVLALAAILTAIASPSAQAAAPGSITEAFKAHTSGSELTIDHSAWDQLLKAYVLPGNDGVNRVAYATFKADGHKTLKSYISQLEKADPAKLDRPEQFAFWANLYNAKTIDVILDYYPVKSIRDISLDNSLFGALKSSVGAGGPWKTPVVTVSGRQLSLDNIEHDIMRPVFSDPRVHYSVNCASYGCPNLAGDAFTGAELEAQLDAGARSFINHPRGIAVEDGTVRASSIYSWFQKDFGGNAAGVLAHARQYADAELAAKLKNVTAIDTYDYDWSLNDASIGTN